MKPEDMDHEIEMTELRHQQSLLQEKPTGVRNKLDSSVENLVEGIRELVDYVLKIDTENCGRRTGD